MPCKNDHTSSLTDYYGHDVMLDEFLKFDAVLEPDSRWSESQLELELAKVIMAFVKAMFANCYRWCSRKHAVMQRKYECSRRTNLIPCTLWCLHSSSSIFWKDKSVKCKSSHADHVHATLPVQYAIAWSCLLHAWPSSWISVEKKALFAGYTH